MTLTDWLQWGCILFTSIIIYIHMKAKDAHPDMRREISRKQAEAYGKGKPNEIVRCSNCGQPLLYDQPHACIHTPSAKPQ